ncbi:MAG: hypothetical protein V3U42_04005 [candidate division NC10 bacterium]
MSDEGWVGGLTPDEESPSSVMQPTVAKAMGVTNAVVAKAVMPTRKSLVPMHEWPVTIEALPVREDPVVAMGPELVMV